MKFVLAAVAATVLAGSALAGSYNPPVQEQDVIVQDVVVTDSSDWTGFYAGAQVGTGNGKVSYRGFEEKGDVEAYGVHGGYQRDFGTFVFGGELDFNKLNDGDGADLIRLRARAGYDLGRVLPYITVGAAHVADGDLSENGVTYGIGADFKVNDKFTVGAEYSKQDFNDFNGVDGLDLNTDMVQLRAAFRF